MVRHADVEISVMKEEFLYIHKSLEIRGTTIQGSTRVSQKTEGVGKIQPGAFIVVSASKARRGRGSRCNIG